MIKRNSKTSYDWPQFINAYPEFEMVRWSILKRQWDIARHHVKRFANPQRWHYMQMTAHLLKLTLLAQRGKLIGGKNPPVLSAPIDAKAFNAWLQQTEYGQAIG